MNSKNWVRLFFSTLIVGAVSTAVVGYTVKWEKYQPLFTSLDWKEIISVLFWFIGVGFIFSIISQMGFFAYLTVHRFGLGIFRAVWNLVQIVLIAFILFDLVYFRYVLFADSDESIGSYMVIMLVIFIFSLVVAYVKSKQTNKHAFIPALFFMVVVTTIEWFPALKVNEEGWLYLMLFPLLICNAYQLLILHKLNQTKTE